MTLRAESDDLLHLDTTRFIAASGIVFHHAINYTTFSWRENAEPLRLFVDLFFVISGFVIAFVYAGDLQYKNFLIKRAARLVPLHWLTLLFVAGLGLAASLMGQQVESAGMFDPACFLPNALLIHSLGVCHELSFNGPSWSISAEAVMYLLTPLVFWIARRPWLGLAVIAASIAGFEALSVPARHWTDWTWDGGFLRAWPSYLLGAMMFFHRDRLRRIPLGAVSAALFLAAFITAAFMGVPQSVLIFLVYATAASVVAADMKGGASRLTRAAAPLGQLTYSSYMLHVPILTVMASAPVVAILGVEGWSKNLLVLVALIVVLAASYLSYVYFETPARRWVGSLARRRKPDAAGQAPAP